MTGPAQPTPGPWKVERDYRSGSHRIYRREEGDIEGGAICDVFERYGEEDANARLIAAAPELLAFVEDVEATLATLTSEQFALGADKELRERASALLAAVRGRP